MDEANRMLTEQGRIAFSRRSADERKIITWLLGLDQDMPWRGEDIAAMVLNGDHLQQEQGQ